MVVVSGGLRQRRRGTPVILLPTWCLCSAELLRRSISSSFLLFFSFVSFTLSLFSVSVFFSSSSLSVLSPLFYSPSLLFSFFPPLSGLFSLLLLSLILLCFFFFNSTSLFCSVFLFFLLLCFVSVSPLLLLVAAVVGS